MTDYSVRVGKSPDLTLGWAPAHSIVVEWGGRKFILTDEHVQILSPCCDSRIMLVGPHFEPFCTKCFNVLTTKLTSSADWASLESWLCQLAEEAGLNHLEATLAALESAQNFQALHPGPRRRA